jgi:hypothetical protein
MLGSAAGTTAALAVIQWGQYSLSVDGLRWSD